MYLVWSYSCLCPIHWSQVLSREWRCSWSSADTGPTGDAPTTSEWSTILLRTKVRCVLEVWQYMQNEDFFARSRYLRQGLVITSHNKLWDAITYPCLRYLLLAKKSSNVVHFVEASVYYRNDSIAWCIWLLPPIAVMSHEHHSISNHWQLYCMINRLFRLTSKKTPKFCASLIPWWGGSPSVDFPHKGPVMQKLFPCHDITVECCCNMVQYNMILHTPCRNWGRISWGVFCEYFDLVITTPHCIMKVVEMSESVGAAWHLQLLMNNSKELGFYVWSEDSTRVYEEVDCLGSWYQP